MIKSGLSKLTEVDAFRQDFLSNQFNYEAFLSFMQNFASEHPKPPKPELLCAVFKGGGVKVTGYLGVLMAMQEKGLIDKMHYVAGSSGGAIFALLLGLGFDGYQIIRLFKQLDMSDLTDKRDSPLGAFYASSALSQLFSVLTNGKVYSGQNIRDWAEGLIEHVLGDKDASFSDLHEAKKKNPTLKEMYFVATKLRPGTDQSQETVFGLENYPHARISDSFCASTALPPVYQPVLVRMKDGSEIGYCNDGGLLNNFPVGVFDHNQYCERHYKLKFTRYRDNATPHAVNPCTVGCSLIAQLEQMDPAITPFTPRLKGLVSESVVPNVSAIIKDKKHTWSHWDIIKALLKYKFGRLEPENSYKKYQTHPENIIQIYVENVDTTEFDLSPEKTHLIVESGRNAFNLWYEKFRNPQDTYKGDYIVKLPLSQEERTLKKANPRAFYIEKAADHLGHFCAELIRLKNTSVEDLKLNARLIHLAFKINKDHEKLLTFADPQEAMAQAFAKAGKAYVGKQDRIRQVRIFLDHMVDADGIIRQLRFMMLDVNENENSFERLLKSQLSNAFRFCLEYDDALINVAAKSCAKQIPFLVSHLKEKHEHLYQIGRAKEHSLEHMLNCVPKTPILFSANDNPDVQSVVTCLAMGLDPTLKHTGGKTALHDAIDKGNLPALCLYLTDVKRRGVRLDRITFGPYQKPLVHYLLETVPPRFLEQLQAADHVVHYEWLIKQAGVDKKGIDVYEQLAGTKGVYYWSNAKERFAPKSKDLFTSCLSRYNTKSMAYKEHLDQVKQELMTANYFNPDKLSKATSNELLALLGDKTLANPIAQSTIKHWNGFVTQYFERLLQHGFHREIEVALSTPIEGKTLSELAEEFDNLALCQYFDRLTGQDINLSDSLDEDMIYAFAKTECDYRLRPFNQSKHSPSVPSLRKMLMGESPSQEENVEPILMLKRDAHECKALLDLQACFLEKQMDLDEFLGKHDAADVSDLLRYAKTHDDELANSIKGFLMNPQVVAENDSDELVVDLTKTVSNLKL